jgi:diketogulonate reductase-like aldo/keto reductase
MPAIELGAFGSDHADPEAVADAVSGAYEAASRHFDCAAVYGIDPRVGRLIGSSACGKVGVCFDEGLQA